MNNYYTYAWLREDGTPYYIGKGKGRRAYERRRKYRPPIERILILKSGLTEEEAFRHEVYMIAVLGRKCHGGILHNHTDGGDGRSGWIAPPETRQKMSSTRRGKSLAWPESRPREFSPEARENMSKGHTGRKQSPEHNSSISNALKNLPKVCCIYCGKITNTQNMGRHQRSKSCKKSM
jgi:hypothetical protein